MPGSDSRSDEPLVAAANAGDAAAFEALYERHRDWVLRLACRFTQDHAEALDVLQDTFTYLLRKFPGFTLTARLTTFLYPVVKNVALARRRKRRPHSVAPEELAAATLTAPPDPLPGAADLSELAGVLATLPEGQREVLLMRFVDDLALAEIAVALEIPVGTVKSRLHNALATLRADGRVRRYFGE